MFCIPRPAEPGGRLGRALRHDPADFRDVTPCSPRKGAAETDASAGSVALRAVVVETSTFTGRGAKAIAKAASAMDAAIEGFHTVYGCNRGAAAFERSGGTPGGGLRPVRVLHARHDSGQ